MQLEEDEIREFQQLWLDEFKEEISSDDARQRFYELIEVYALFARVARTGPGSEDASANP